MKNCSIQLVTYMQGFFLLPIRTEAVFHLSLSLDSLKGSFNEEELDLFERDTAPDGYMWLSVEHGSEKPVYKILNSTQ